MELTKTDVDILCSLQEEGRLSFRDLATRTGVSVPTISAHVSTLEELGIIRGYRADIDPERLNETSVVLLIKCAPPAASPVAQAVAKLPEVRWVMAAQGPRILALATVSQDTGIDGVLEAVAQVPGILDYEHFVVASVAKDEPRARITDRLSTTLICFQCKGPIHREPVKVRMDGRDHYLCCHTCEKEYVERYQRIKARA